MTHKEMTSHIRNRIRTAGIDAHVRMGVACGVKYIKVNVARYEQQFSAEEFAAIQSIAKVNGLTNARNSEIDESFHCVWGAHYEFHDERPKLDIAFWQDGTITTR